jgi:ferritin-like metal-binding protein YciE
MSTIDSMHALLCDELRDLYDAEKRLTKAIPKLAKKVSHDDLRSALEEHLQETEHQVVRLEEAFGLLGERARAKPCAGMRGIIEEGDEHASADYGDDSLRDAVIIGSAQRVEHYEMAAYGTAIAHARQMGGHDRVVDLLEESLAEEKAADSKLTQIAESVVNVEAVRVNGDEGAHEERGVSGRRSPRSVARAIAPASRRTRAARSGSSRRKKR